MQSNNKQKGVSLVITFFIMIIILLVVLSVSVLLYSEVKVLRNISNSVVGFYAAESGIEKVLYYDRQVLPTNRQSCTTDSDCASFSLYTSCKNGLCTIPSSRGLCSIFSSCTTGNSGETSIYCCNYSDPGSNCPAPADPVGSACTPNDCTNCSVSFATVFDNRIYYTTAKVYPDAAKPSDSDFEIDSKGVFGSASRQIQILITPK